MIPQFEEIRIQALKELSADAECLFAHANDICVV